MAHRRNGLLPLFKNILIVSLLQRLESNWNAKYAIWKQEKLSKKIRKCTNVMDVFRVAGIIISFFFHDRCGASLEEIQEEAQKALQDWDKARKAIEEMEVFVKVRRESTRCAHFDRPF
jgi:hypothetical protein